MGLILDRARRARGGEAGGTLLLTLVVLSLSGVIFASLMAFVMGYLRSSSPYQARTDSAQTHSDAVEFAVNAVRNNNTVGRAGTSSSWTYSGVSVTCTGDPGSGVPSGAGRTDRLVTCKSSLVSAQVRYFDRGGSGSGVISEVISWKLLN